MPNVNDAFGALPTKTDGKQGKVSYYTKKTGAALAPGDFVIADALGNVTIATGGDGVTLLGVAAEYKAASDVSQIAIYDDPEATFEIQASANLAVADVFQNANIVATALDSALLQSKQALDSSSLGTGATKQLKILGLSKEQGAEWGSFAKVQVRINNHALRGGVAGV
jgi:hypothetical protein